MDYTPLPINQIEARAKLAAEWSRDGKITREEQVRLECDAMHGVDRGPVRWKGTWIHHYQTPAKVIPE